MSALDYALHGDMDADGETNYLGEVDEKQPYSLRLINNPCHHTNVAVHDWRQASRPAPLHEVEFHDPLHDESTVDISPTSSNSPAEQARCATLLTRIREKVFARMTTCDDAVPASSDKDYLAPDIDSGDEDESDDEEDDGDGMDNAAHRTSRKRDLQTFLMGTRSLDYDLLVPPPSSDPTPAVSILPTPPRVMPLPFLILPHPPSMSAKPGPAVAKCLLPAVPHRPPLRKYNHRTIYNCVRCGQLKKNHKCSFPENVRSVGTAMSSTSIPRDTVARYYKCSRVLVCKKYSPPPP